MKHSKLINNINERVVDDIKGRLSKGTFVSIAAASFSIYAYEALKRRIGASGTIAFHFHISYFHQGQIKERET